MPDELALDCWFDELPEPARTALSRRASEVPPMQTLLTPDQGDNLAQHLEAGARRFRAQTAPFYFARLGDCELALLGSGLLSERMPIEALRPLDAQLAAAGLSRECLGLRAEFVEAIRHASLLGVQQNWAPIREASSVLLALSGFHLPACNAVDFHLLYKLLIDGGLFSYLSGKRVVLIGHLAPRLANLLSDRRRAEEFEAFGPLTQTQIVGVLQTRDRNEGAWRDLKRVTDFIHASEFDVALLACGAAAKILAYRIWKSGRSALDAGFIFDALLGNQERTQRAVLRDGKWPMGSAAVR